jgi:hypothetical protein
MDEIVKALAGAEGVNLALLLAVLAEAVAVIFLFRQMNKERELDRADRLKATEQQAAAMEKLGAIVTKLGDVVADLRVAIASRKSRE